MRTVLQPPAAGVLLRHCPSALNRYLYAASEWQGASLPGVILQVTFCAAAVSYWWLASAAFAYLWQRDHVYDEASVNSGTPAAPLPQVLAWAYMHSAQLPGPRVRRQCTVNFLRAFCFILSALTTLLQYYWIEAVLLV